MYRFTLFTLFLLLSYNTALSNDGVIRGNVVDASTNEPLIAATVIIQGTQTGTTTDSEGRYRISNLEPGLYNVEFRYLGYRTKVEFEVQVTRARDVILNVTLQEDSSQLDEVVVRSSRFERPEESPLSYRSIGTSEIERSPGANRDISRVILNLPGVTSGIAGFRNDLIVRGGAPSENKFYLDDVEVPTINHFATQGSSGGPTGLINVDFIRSAELYTGAFPAARGNALSSILELRQKDGDDSYGGTFTLGASEAGGTFQGPLGENANFIFSLRRSYLQYLFQVLELPFLPTYTDIQFRFKWNINSQNEFTFIGLGAINDFELNTAANETEQQRYILNNLPVNNQWNYTRGLRYRYFHDSGFITFVASRNRLFNEAFKYENNDDSSPENLILNYESMETENKLRLENFIRYENFRIQFGGNYEYAVYTNDTFNRISTPAGLQIVDFSSELALNKWGAFTQASTRVLNDRLSLSAGFRFDATDFSEETNNLLDQFSPRVSASYRLTNALSVNANTGIFYQLPSYTVLGFRNNDGELINRDNGIRYIRANHYVGGLNYVFERNLEVSVEGFLKQYSDYPFLTREQVSLANLGSDFGVIGNEPATPDSEGRAYGIEVSAQQKLFENFFGILAYTYVRSEFENTEGNYVPSAWDNRHILTFSGGYRIGNNWEIGARFEFLSGAPFTPYDRERSALKAVWDINGIGLPDYDRLNSERTSAAHQLDIRIDRKFFFSNWDLNVYLDIANVYASTTTLQSFLNVREDDMGNPITNPERPDSYLVYDIENSQSTVLPTIGLVINF